MFSKHQRYFFLVSIFCWMICNWELFDIQNSRENRSKNQNKLVYENGHAVACVQGSVRSWLWALETECLWQTLPLPSLIVPFCARIYGGPQLSRQNQKPHGKNKIPHGKTENLKAKTKTSRQNRNLMAKKQKPHGKTENFVYFVFAVKFLVLPWGILFLPWQLWVTIRIRF